MAGKPMLTEKEILTSYTDRRWFNHLLKMHTLTHSFVFNAQGYFDLSIHDALLPRALKRLPYLEEKIEWAVAEFPKISYR
jgi:hypothetical protein